MISDATAPRMRRATLPAPAERQARLPRPSEPFGSRAATRQRSFFISARAAGCCAAVSPAEAGGVIGSGLTFMLGRTRCSPVTTTRSSLATPT